MSCLLREARLTQLLPLVGSHQRAGMRHGGGAQAATSARRSPPLVCAIDPDSGRVAARVTTVTRGSGGSMAAAFSGGRDGRSGVLACDGLARVQHGHLLVRMGLASGEPAGSTAR